MLSLSRNTPRAIMQSAAGLSTLHSGSPRNPPSLPRLPVPDLHKTLERYLKSLEPFLLEDAAVGGRSFDSSRELRVRWADEFERGLGKVCQDRLLALDQASPHNWLDDNFWMKKAYHEWRVPLVVNSNWWLAFKNDPSIPEDVISGPDAYGEGITAWQIKRAASLIHGTLVFKSRQELHPEASRLGVWLQECTAKIFNICRVPQPRCDIISEVPSFITPDARKVLLSVHDWCYVIEVLDDALKIISAVEIQKRIHAVVQDVNSRLARGERAIPVGVLSADERDKWTKNLQYLLSLSQQNHVTLKTIQNSLFAMSLDHYTNLLPSQSHGLPVTDSQPELDAHLCNIRAGHHLHPAHNRWFDKPLTFIVERNTRAGAMGEHSPVDALVPSIVAEYAVVQGIDAAVQSSMLPVDAPTGGWERLEWVTDERIAQECVAAEQRVRAIVDDSDYSVLWFDAYGTEWIKNVAGGSPDAYIQLALQLAWHRTRGCFTAMYETALTRLFQRGRTETIRSFTTDARSFILAMVDPSSHGPTRRALLHRAVQTHNSLTRAAATGRGVDRHLLGLRLMLHAEEGEQPPLFEDELFARSQMWKLSTSGLSAGDHFRGTGFGAAYMDGYGINYMAGLEMIKFGIETKHLGSSTSTHSFKAALVRALLDIRDVCLENSVSHL